MEVLRQEVADVGIMQSLTVTTETHKALLAAKNDASWERYYSGDYPELTDRYDVTVALVRGISILDIGCAEGLLLHLLQQRRPETKRLVGLDASRVMIGKARFNLGDRAELYHSYSEELPFDNSEFDTVVLGQTLEHVRKVEPVAAEAIRVLKPGGRLIVNVPADERRPHGNHLHVFRSVTEMVLPFGMAIDWQGEGRLHCYWFAWGDKR